MCKHRSNESLDCIARTSGSDDGGNKRRGKEEEEGDSSIFFREIETVEVPLTAAVKKLDIAATETIHDYGRKYSGVPNLFVVAQNDKGLHLAQGRKGGMDTKFPKRSYLSFPVRYVAKKLIN